MAHHRTLRLADEMKVFGIRLSFVAAISVLKKTDAISEIKVDLCHSVANGVDC